VPKVPSLGFVVLSVVSACASTRATASVASPRSGANPASQALAALPAGVPVASASLALRLDAVADAFRSRGARPLRERWTGFVRSGMAGTFSLTFARAQCVGFVAVGVESMDDIDLAVSNNAGIQIARDDRRDAHPYVRTCVTPGTTLYVSAIAARGTGEVAVLPLAEPPVVPPPLDGVLDVRPTSLFAGPRVPRNNVGRDPAVIPATEAMRRLIARYQSLGYAPVGDIASGQLEHQGVARRPVRFEEGRCYLVMAVGGDRVEDLDLRVSSPQRRPIVQDTGLDTRPIVRLCASATGEHPAEVRLYAGAGEWALGVMEIPTPEGVALGDDVRGIERARALEVALEASRRAMEPLQRPLRGAVWGVNTQPFPVRLRAGRCYVLGAAASETLAALDLWLADARGAVLASDTSERERATVFHCARRDGLATASVRVHGGRGEYVFQVFESRGATR
jgi:hypothetical protein